MDNVLMEDYGALEEKMAQDDELLNRCVGCHLQHEQEVEYLEQKNRKLRKKIRNLKKARKRKKGNSEEQIARILRKLKEQKKKTKEMRRDVKKYRLAIRFLAYNFGENPFLDVKDLLRESKRRCRERHKKIYRDKAIGDLYGKDLQIYVDGEYREVE